MSNTQYYDKGSVELAVETPVMRARLEKRREVTGSHAERLLIVLVGLPARGKSFLARKLFNYLTWRGNQCRIFNVGQYRRAEAEADEKNEHQGADFFDDQNEEAAAIRQEAASRALKDTLDWLLTELKDEQGSHSHNTTATNTSAAAAAAAAAGPTTKSHASGSLFIGHTSHSSRRQTQRIAIFDATNSTRERRNWILQKCDEREMETGVVFVESICDDKELLMENFRVKIQSCPDFVGMTPEQAMADLQARIQKYESRYETVDDDSQSYIKVYNLSSKLLVNHAYGRLAKVVVPALMAWNTGSRPIFLCRAGETVPAMLPSSSCLSMASAVSLSDLHNMLQEEKKMEATETNNNINIDINHKNRNCNTNTTTVDPNDDLTSHGHVNRRQRVERLGLRGLQFRDALCNFVEKEVTQYMEHTTNVIHPRKFDTGTSMSGLREHRLKDQSSATFPCLIMSSTIPRALETASWQKLPFPVKDVSNLNPLDMGDFTGMSLDNIRQHYPQWYSELEQEPFHTRFPGGEGYGDLINRLESVVIDMEQHLGPVAVVSHTSVLQVLVSYFRSSPVQKCTDINIPMHTVLKFTPLRGGGWLESRHQLLSDNVGSGSINESSLDR